MRVIISPRGSSARQFHAHQTSESPLSSGIDRQTTVVEKAGKGGHLCCPRHRPPRSRSFFIFLSLVLYSLAPASASYPALSLTKILLAPPFPLASFVFLFAYFILDSMRHASHLIVHSKYRSMFLLVAPPTQAERHQEFGQQELSCSLSEDQERSSRRRGINTVFFNRVIETVTKFKSFKRGWQNSYWDWLIEFDPEFQ